MKRWSFLSVLLAALVLGGCDSTNGPSDGLPGKIDTANWAALDAKLDSFLSSNGGPVRGYSFLLFSADGTIHSRAGGNQTIDSAVRIASATKVPSAAAILTLVDQGKLNLDLPIDRYLEAAGNPITLPIDKRNVTMRMLLSHTSGLPGGARAEPNCLDRVLAVSLQSCAQLVALTPLLTAPGTAFAYGGGDYQLAGYIATLIAGKNWQSFFADALGTPLGLTRFTYGDASAVSNPRIAGGANSDVHDYAKILRMIQNGGVADSGQRVLSRSAINELLRNQIAGLPILYAPFAQQARDSYNGYTLGFWVSDLSLHPRSAGPELSDPGLFGTTPWIDQDIGYGAIILIDDNTFTGLDIWNAVRPLIIDQLG